MLSYDVMFLLVLATVLFGVLVWCGNVCPFGLSSQGDGAMPRTT
jgi:polyferredoxin